VVLRAYQASDRYCSLDAPRGFAQSRAARQCTATLVLLSNQSPLKEVEPFLHGIKLVTKLPDCRILRTSNGGVTLKPLGEGGCNSNNGHADRDGRNDCDDGENIVHH
jgi:hypothetical protein